MLKVLIVFILLNGLCFGQMPKWIQSSPCVNSSNQLIPPSTNNLQFYEVDFTGPTPVFTQRNEGASINSIFTSGITELINNGIDANGNISFYVFSESASPFLLNAITDIRFAAFDPNTGKDEIFASIPGNPTNASSVKNIEVLPKKGDPGFYYVVYKTACINYLSPDEIRYVVVNMNTRTISASVLLSSGTNNEGMGISRMDCSTGKRWLFFSKYSGGTMGIYRSEINSTAILQPVLVTSVNVTSISLGQGDLEISPDGTKLAIAMMATADNPTATEDALLFDLNLATGALSNYRWINSSANYITSLEFSPDSQRLYLAQTGTSAIQNKIFNVPVQTTNYTINPSSDEVAVSLNPGGISFEIGFDQKLYFNNSASTDRLFFIANPNSDAAGNSVSQTQANSYGTGNRSGNSFPDQVDGDFSSSSETVSLTTTQQTICAGQSATLVASGGANYSWSNGLTGSASTQIVTPISTTTYHVTSSACDNTTDSVTIVVVENPVAQITGDLEICEGEAITLFGSGANDFFWNGSTTPGQSSITLNPLISAVYTLIVSNGSCSSPTVNFPVTVNPKPQFEITGDTVLCQAETTVLAVNNVFGTAPFSYSWSDGSVNSTNTLTPLNHQELTVVVNDSFNCSDTVIVRIRVEPLPVANFLLSEEGCSPLTVVIQNESVNATDFIWHYGDGTSGFTINGHHTYEAGVYSVSLIAFNSIGCSDTLTAVNTLNVWSSPDASFAVSGIDPSNPTDVQFINHSSVSDSCTFYFGDGTITTDCNWNRLLHHYPAESVYTATQILTNESGCSDTATYQLNLYGEIIFYVPNTFTPDGNELNNVFSVVLPDNLVLDQFKLTIFNRWGEIIFETGDRYEGWDATYIGKHVKEGTYTWKLHLDDGRREGEFTGHVNVLR